MNDEPHVGFVDAHAESIGSHNHAYFARLPCILPLMFLLRQESGMIGGGLNAVGAEEVGNLAGAAAGAHVDNRRARHVAEHFEYLALLVVGVAHDVGDVVAGEAAAEYCRLLHVEPSGYVVDDVGGGRCRQGEHGHFGKHLPERRYAQV